MSLRFWISFVLFFCSIPTGSISQQNNYDIFEQNKFILLPTLGSNKHLYEVPYDGFFVALNGVSHDASQYYRSRKNELNIRGVAAIFLADGISLKFNWNFDLGYKSDLYTVGPSLLTGLTLIETQKEYQLEIGVQNAFFIGGNVSETACVDILAREFHCGLGMPWTDYGGHSVKPEGTFFFNYTHFF